MNLIDLATFSRKHFFFFVKKCNEIYRSGHDLSFYRELIDMHRKHGKLEPLLGNNAFVKLLYETLEKWNMNQRGARLVAFDDFMKSIRFWKDYLVKLYEYKLYGDIDNEIKTINDMLGKVFIYVKVMQSKRKIVGVSKTLHFLLPDLIMPIDGKFTMPAFFGFNKNPNSPEKESITFKEIFNRTIEITNRLQLDPSDVDGEKWNTSVPKLIDNAIIGLLKSEEGEVRSLF